MAISEAPDYYRILRVDPQAEPEVINAAYRKLAAMYHPDVDPSPDAQARMVEINQAYGVLRDPEARATYDRARGLASARRAAAAHPASATPRSSVEGFARAILMMVISGIILNLLFSAFAGAGGRWMAIGVIVAVLLWKWGPIFRYFSGKG
jgi:DnaJ-class molecular chaperone